VKPLRTKVLNCYCPRIAICKPSASAAAAVVLSDQVSHTEPDHSFLVPAVLDLYPEATVVGSKVCINFLKGLSHR
jgi:hypothetical protein